MSSLPQVSVATQTEFSSPVITVVSVQLSTKQAVTTSAEMKICDDTAILTFKKAEIMSADAFKAFRVNYTIPEGSATGFGVFTMIPEDSERPQVQRVLVNLNIPVAAPDKSGVPDNSDNSKWYLLLKGVESCCQLIFKNMKPEESAFNVRFGHQLYSADKHFYITGSCEINVIPK